jgi:hypothetical protein
MASPSASASLMARWETSGAASWSRTIVSRPDFANRCKLSAVMAPLSSASMTSTSRCRVASSTRRDFPIMWGPVTTIARTAP